MASCTVFDQVWGLSGGLFSFLIDFSQIDLKNILEENVANLFSTPWALMESPE